LDLVLVTEEGFDIGKGGEVEELDGAVERGGVELLGAEAESERLWKDRVRRMLAKGKKEEDALLPHPCVLPSPSTTSRCLPTRPSTQ
jgi:hypothetical protein